jgi:hypothetical protein
MFFRQALVPIGYLDKFRVSEHARSALCTPCPVHMKCWSCPDQNDGYNAYHDGAYSHCLVYLFWTDVGEIPSHADPYQVVLDAYATVASYITHYGRDLERRLSGKEMIDGRCAVCRVCTAAETPARPCAYPESQRSSLEALGINVTRLSNDIFDHRLHWYHKNVRTPAYVTVVHGLLTNTTTLPDAEFEPALATRASDWLDEWRAGAPDH